MDEILQKKLNDAVWVAHSLFDRGKTSGSSANLSILHNGTIYITASGTCFGTLQASDFAAVTMDGETKSALKPSKELRTCRQSSIPTARILCCGRAAGLTGRQRYCRHIRRTWE